MKKLLFLIFLLFGFISPLKSDSNKVKEYPKYSFYAKCLDDALPRTINNGLVYECSKKAKDKIDDLIKGKITSRGDCYEEGYESHACQLKRSQQAFKNYYLTECKWNTHSAMNIYCEMLLKKDRLKWLDKTLGN